MSHNSNLFSDLDIEFIDHFIKYLSHCSYRLDNILFDNIIKENMLKGHNSPNADESYMHNKVFCRIDDKYLKSDNHYCGLREIGSYGIEFQLNPDLLKKHKFYIITEPQSYGSLESAMYISPYLFNVLKTCDFDKNLFKAFFTNVDLDDLTREILLNETDDLFNSNVVKQKYNPPICYPLIRMITDRHNMVATGYGLTVAFFSQINLKSNLNKVIIGSSIDSDIQNKIIETCSKNDIVYDVKTFKVYH
jgi:hypothetical protein